MAPVARKGHFCPPLGGQVLTAMIERGIVTFMTTLLVYLEGTDQWEKRVYTREIICPDMETVEEYLERYKEQPNFLDFDIVDTNPTD